MTDTPVKSASAMAHISFWLGLGSLAAIPVFAFSGFLIEDMGMMQPLYSLVFPAALAAIILGAIFRKKTEQSVHSRRQAKAGIIMGAISIGLIMLLIVMVMIIFLPMRS